MREQRSGRGARHIGAIAALVVALGVCAYAGGKPQGARKAPAARGGVTLERIKSNAKTGKRASAGASANVGQTIKLEGSGFGENVMVEFVGFAGSAFTIRPTQVKPNKSVSAVVPDEVVTGNVRLVDQAGTSGGVKLQIVPTISTFSPAEAAVGARLLIDGAGFTHDTVVSFPGVAKPVAPKIVSPSRIDIVVPAGARTGKVTVSSLGGRSAGKKLVVGSGKAPTAMERAGPVRKKSSK